MANFLQRSPSRWIGGAALIPRAAVAPAMGSLREANFTKDLTATGLSPILYVSISETWANHEASESLMSSKIRLSDSYDASVELSKPLSSIALSTGNPRFGVLSCVLNSPRAIISLG